MRTKTASYSHGTEVALSICKSNPPYTLQRDINNKITPAVTFINLTRQAPPPTGPPSFYAKVVYLGYKDIRREEYIILYRRGYLLL